MPQILFIDSALDGHHISYMSSIISEEDIVILPQKTNLLPAKRTYEIDCSFNQSRKWADYLRWMYEIQRIVKMEKPDIVHFLTGDSLYRFFGVGLREIQKYAKIVFTCHQIRKSYFHNISYKRISRHVNNMVVHSESLCDEMKNLKINNVTYIEYPKFSAEPAIPQKDALARLHIKQTGEKVLLALGGTRMDKGLDILIKALQKVEIPFHLIIAGQEETFKKEYIEKGIAGYRDQVTLRLGYLDDKEFAYYLNATDIVVLPYRKIFNGASGPLGEGVALGKMVIGPNHGCLGETIKNNQLGFTFEAENIDSLATCINIALSANWKPGVQYYQYQKKIQPEEFRKKYKLLYSIT